ncbi:MAG: patatin-like phospholipase family protein [Rhodospirillaceae bacterium]|nr:patatin-like phospholipase family protein [Rhodospirillaceae bacterium]
MPRPAHTPRIGLALGAGGARGFAHLVVLQAFDELGVKPAMIAGSSMGAILGAAYAAGTSARDIKAMVEELYGSRTGNLLGFLMRRDFLKYVDLIDPTMNRGGILRGERFVNFLLDLLKARSFEDLAIPLQTVATDFWRQRPVVFASGPLFPALKASMAAPLVFTPEQVGDAVLVDGALSNPVPWDLLADDSDIVIAVDVMDTRHDETKGIPDFATVIAEQLDSLTRALINERRKWLPPDIFLAPRLPGVSCFDFYKVKEIYAMALPMKDKLKRDLERLMSNPVKRIKSAARQIVDTRAKMRRRSSMKTPT